MAAPDSVGIDKSRWFDPGRSYSEVELESFDPDAAISERLDECAELVDLCMRRGGLRLDGDKFWINASREMFSATKWYRSVLTRDNPPMLPLPSPSSAEGRKLSKASREFCGDGDGEAFWRGRALDCDEALRELVSRGSAVASSGGMARADKKRWNKAINAIVQERFRCERLADLFASAPDRGSE